MIQQADNNDNIINERNDEPFVLPCIMDPGPYDLSWLLEPGEFPDTLKETPYLNNEDIQKAV